MGIGTIFYSLDFKPRQNYMSWFECIFAVIARSRPGYRDESDETLSVFQPVLSMSISLLAGVLPKYFHSEWSVAQFRLHEGEQYIVAFGHEKNTVAVVGMDGR
jgi:hypothetical protein